MIYSSSRSTELNLASTSVAILTTYCSMTVSWMTKQRGCKHTRCNCLQCVFKKTKPNFDVFAGQMYLYSVGQGQASESRTDDFFVTEYDKKCHWQGHDRSHEVQHEGEQTCPSVKQKIVVGVDVNEGHKPTVLQGTAKRLRTYHLQPGSIKQCLQHRPGSEALKLKWRLSVRQRRGYTFSANHKGQQTMTWSNLCEGTIVAYSFMNLSLKLKAWMVLRPCRVEVVREIQGEQLIFSIFFIW